VQIIAMTTSGHWWWLKFRALAFDVFSGLSDRVVDPGNLFADVEFGFVGCHGDN
jgi:hypothetical protein